MLQNRYRILDILGVGGMSTVYKSRDLRFTSVDRVCAVKEMFNSGDDPKMRQLRLSNFQREAALLATLTHSAIPRIYDYFEQQGTVYLVLELISGNDLETLLTQRGGAFDQHVVLAWAKSLCSVMSYLHNQKPEPIIFRDLKPSNVMIRVEDNALMLVDFGIARSFAPQQKGTMIGTEGYAPPEQYKGIADARGDIYAFGATLHHLATYSDPRIETPFTFSQRPPRRLNPFLTAEFEELILKCVAYSPDDRYQSAEELMAALERARGWGEVAPKVSAPSPQVVIPVEERDRTSGSSVLAKSPALPEPEKVVEPAPTDDARVAWTVRTADEVRCTASLAGGTVYIGSYDGSLYAIDESDGMVRWTFGTQKGIVTRPAPIAEMVVFGSEDRTVYAVSRQHGRSLWTFRTNGAIRSSPAVDERSVFVGSDDGFMYRIDRLKGHVLWRHRTWEPIRSSPLIVGQLIIFGSDDGYFYAVHRDSGALQWRFHVGSPVMSSPAIWQEQVIFGATDGGIRSVGLHDGRLAWVYMTSRAVISTPLIVDETAYVGSANGHVYALACASGEVNWDSQVCRQIASSAVADGELIYIGGNDGVFYALARNEGHVKWTFAVEKPIVTRPLVTGEHIIFGSLDGNVYALNRGS